MNDCFARWVSTRGLCQFVCSPVVVESVDAVVTIGTVLRPRRPLHVTRRTILGNLPMRRLVIKGRGLRVQAYRHKKKGLGLWLGKQATGGRPRSRGCKSRAVPPFCRSAETSLWAKRCRRRDPSPCAQAGYTKKGTPWGGRGSLGPRSYFFSIQTPPCLELRAHPSENDPGVHESSAPEVVLCDRQQQNHEDWVERPPAKPRNLGKTRNIDLTSLRNQVPPPNPCPAETLSAARKALCERGLKKGRHLYGQGHVGMRVALEAHQGSDGRGDEHIRGGEVLGVHAEHHAPVAAEGVAARPHRPPDRRSWGKEKTRLGPRCPADRSAPSFSSDSPSFHGRPGKRVLGSNRHLKTHVRIRALRLGDI